MANKKANTRAATQQKKEQQRLEKQQLADARGEFARFKAETHGQILERIHRIIKDWGVFTNVDSNGVATGQDKQETSSKLTYTLRWPNRHARVDPDTGYLEFFEKLKTELNLDISKLKIVSGSKTEVCEITLPPLTMKVDKQKAIKTVNLRFKFDGTALALTNNDTRIQESIHAWYLTYLLKGGQRELTIPCLTEGKPEYIEFNRLINGKVSTWNEATLMSDARVFLAEKAVWRHSINQACHILKDKIDFNDSSSWIIDRPDDIPASNNPYDVYGGLKGRLSFSPENDKWNPGDIWFLNQTGKSNMSQYKRDFSNVNTPTAALTALNEFNGFLIKEYEDGNIIGISLKKMGLYDNGYTPHFDVVNQKNYFDEEVQFDERKGIVLSENNMDVQIYIKIRRVVRDPETEEITSIDGTWYTPEIFMKLKTESGGFRIELYIQGTEARHGSLGTKSYQKAIYKTDTQGIENLLEVRKEPAYDTVKDHLKGVNDREEWIAFKVVRNTDSENYDVLRQYLTQIYNYVNGPTSRTEFTAANADVESGYLQTKIVASELGYAIKGVENKKRIDVICENLYRIAASRGITYGSTQQVQARIGQEQRGKSRKGKEVILSGLGARDIVMNSSIHAKVY